MRRPQADEVADAGLRRVDAEDEEEADQVGDRLAGDVAHDVVLGARPRAFASVTSQELKNANVIAEAPSPMAASARHRRGSRRSSGETGSGGCGRAAACSSASEVGQRRRA